MLCRAGVGALTVVDFGCVGESNLNRQLLALNSTIGEPKAQVAKRRLTDINPECRVEAHELFLAEDTLADFELESFDFILDCIDSLNPKTQVIRACVERGASVVVSAGAGGRLDPTGVEVIGLDRVVGCPLASHLRRRLRRLGIDVTLPTVASPILPTKPKAFLEEQPAYQRGRNRSQVGSISSVPNVFGCVMASWVVRQLLGQ
jgi:tRNA A37 threonylcarbamoyladenosine dehydratase